MQALVNINIDHYQIERLLAHGGMADIYLALDTQTQEYVAIKMVHTNQEEYCERFKREARTMAALPHEHILPILDYGEYASWCYFVMPYIEEGTLGAMLERGALSLERAGKILRQLADALHFAHTHSIVHRDIKPSNILMHAGEHVYLSDFGLAKPVGEKTGLTISGYVIGTPDYMAPELVEEEATPLSDIYALGALLYQMLTGRVPFKGSTPIATLMKQVSEEPMPPSMFNPRIPEGIEQVIMCALDKEPQYRFQTAVALWEAYEQSLEAAEQKRQFLEELPTNGSIPALHATLRKATLPQNHFLSAAGGVQVVTKKTDKARKIYTMLLPVAVILLLVPLVLKTSFPKPEMQILPSVQKTYTPKSEATPTPRSSVAYPPTQPARVPAQSAPAISQPARVPAQSAPAISQPAYSTSKSVPDVSNNSNGKGKGHSKTKKG